MSRRTPAGATTLGRHPALRFLVVGGANTLITAAVVVGLSYVVDGRIAFTIAFALGLIFSVAVTGKWVFHSDLTFGRAIAFGSSYVVIYFVGLAFVSLVEQAGGPAWLNGGSVLITAPLSFIAGRYIFRQNPSGKGTNV